MKLPVKLVEGSSAVEAKQKGKWLSSEMEIAIDGTSEEESREAGDVWERDFPEWNCSRNRALDLHQTGVWRMISEVILGSSILKCL